MNNQYYPNQSYLKNYEQQPNSYQTNEQLYIENILKINKGKKANLHITIPTSNEWQDKNFEGIIEQSGKDYIIISNPNTGEWNLIPLIYLDYITFEEPINYKQDIFIPSH